MRGAAAGLLLLAALSAAAAPAPLREERPFPDTGRSVILREEKVVYIVDGTVTVPRGVEVSIQKDVYVRGKGGPATIVVEGNLECHGVSGRDVIFEGVTVVPAARFQKIQIDTCTFRGGGGVRTAEGAPAEGDLQIQLSSFEGGATLEVAFTAGSVQLLDTPHMGTVRIAGVDGEGKPNRLKTVLRGSRPDGLHIENAADATVRLCRIGKGPVVLRDNRVLVFDGCKVEADTISFLQSRAGGFGKTKVMKCDLYCGRVVFRAPLDPKVTDTVVVDKCWFEGETGSDEVAERIVDAADEEDNNVRVRVSNPQKRPLELAGSVDR